MHTTKRRIGARLARVAVLVLLLTGMLPVGARAQSQASSGQIAGEILDSSGAAVTGATVTATNTETGLERSANTNDEGLYSIVLLPPGTYRVSAKASGFQDVNVENVDVVVGRTAEVNLTIAAGGVVEEVTVTAGAVQVQTTRSEPDSVLNERAIANLPINGRRFQDFVTLTPTAQVEPSRQQISLAGQRGINANINIDGVDYNNPFFGGIRGGERSNFAFTVPQEAIREFQVVASGYSAEFGRSTGGIVNAVTKSGTNEYHGSAFYLLRHKELARSNDFFEAVALRDPTNPNDDLTVTPVPTLQQWGGSLGGPIKRDKLFFFGAYEQQRLRQGRTTVFDGLAGFTPTADTEEAFMFFKSEEGPFTQTNDAIALLGRADYEVNEKNRFNIRYSFSDNNGENATNTGNTIFPTTNRAVSNDGTEKDRNHTVVGQWTSFFTDTIVNEMRGQYSRERRPRLANSTIPNIAVNFGNTGNRNFLPNEEVDWRFQIADNVTWTSGNHTVKFGVEYNHVDVFQTFGFNQFGAYNFFNTPDVTLELLSVGGPTANRFDNRSVTFRQQIGNLEAGIITDELAFFAQDSWRIRPNFTLNFGLRWEGQFNSQPEANNTDLVETVRNFLFPIGRTVDPTEIPDSTNQWGPRLGFAYDPWNDSKTVIRGYGGIYYARSPALIFASPVNNFRLPPGDVSVQLPFPVAAGQPNTVYQQFQLIGIDLNDFGLGELPTLTQDQISRIAEALGFEPNPFLGANLTVVAPDFENPKSYQFGIGVERELTQGLTVGADFAYVHTVHLERNRDLNLPAPTVRADDPAQRPFFSLFSMPRPIPTLGQIFVRESTAKSLYRALTFSTKFQRDWGQLNAYYTLSYNYSDDDNERSSGGQDHENSFNLAPEYNYSNLDRRHQFVANPLVFLPWDIDVSSAIRLRSGTPIDARIGSDFNQDRTNLDRPFSAPGVPFKRNSFRNEPIYSVDLRVQKRFEVGENGKVIFSVEFFNLFNFENTQLSQLNTGVVNYCVPAPGTTTIPADCGFGAPTNPNFLSLVDRNPDSKTFGLPLTGNDPGAPFQVQLGLRYQF